MSDFPRGHDITLLFDVIDANEPLILLIPMFSVKNQLIAVFVLHEVDRELVLHCKLMNLGMLGNLIRAYPVFAFADLMVEELLLLHASGVEEDVIAERTYHLRHTNSACDADIFTVN